MEFVPTRIPDVVLIKPRVFGDPRGFFFESWNRKHFAEGSLDRRLRAGQSQSFGPVDLAGAALPGASRPRENWCASAVARRSTLRWMCDAGSRRPSATGWAPSSALKITRCCGCRPGLRTVPGADRRGRLPLQVHGLLRARTRARDPRGTIASIGIEWPIAVWCLAAALGARRAWSCLRRCRIPLMAAPLQSIADGRDGAGRSGLPRRAAAGSGPARAARMPTLISGISEATASSVDEVPS